MGRVVTVTPKTVRKKLGRLRPGSTLVLEAGRYRDPLVLSGLSGTPDDPIRVRGLEGAVFGGRLTFEQYRRTGNVLASDLERSGRFPGLHHVADEAHLILRDCQWIVIEELCFRRCWPTAIYIENCQQLTLRRLDFKEGSFAIGATGRDTRHLTIEKCSWRQDVSAERALWHDIEWRQLHGYWRGYVPALHNHEGTGHVEIDGDARAYDGDFFRAWNIAGFVVIRDNLVSDAYNGVHFFNKEPGGPSDVFSRNVLIERNTFVRLRDNAVEPEDFAWNWIVRHNRFIDCYSPFSIDLDRSGYFYVYGNLGWSTSRPGPENDPHTLGRLYKMPKRHKADGPHYFVHNSWYIRSPIINKKRFANFHHLNNAVDYNRDIADFTVERSGPFGREWQMPDPVPKPPTAPPPECLPECLPNPLESQDLLESERKRFSKRWAELEIRFDGDIVNHPDFPDRLRGAGYPLDPASKGGAPGFRKPGRKAKGLKLARNAKARGAAVGFEVEFANGRSVEVPGGGHVGAWQEDGLFELPGLRRRDKPPSWTV